MNLEVQNTSALLTVITVDDNWPLELDNGKQNVTLLAGMTGN